MGRLAGGVAHDFNNLLTVIAGYGQLAIECAGAAPSEPLATYLQEILDCSRRATGLTTQLLAFSRRQIPQPKVLNLGPLVRGMEKLLQRVIGEHVELTVRISPDECVIEADPNQMEQAILNLADKASDAMPLGGHLDLSVERLAQPIHRESRAALAILLEARDDGIGMDEGVRAKIFDPFFTSKEPGKGTGLGLSTVYGAVSQANGRIDVESTPGEGSVFRLYFPEAQSGLDAPAAGQTQGVPRGRETVLLVEDEVSVRTLAETILRRLGYNVLVAESGPEAIQIWEAHEGAVDVLLTDVIMPQMSGGELADQLRERQPHLRVLFMSGYTDDIIADHGVMAGEIQLIQKPFTTDALARNLRAVLDA
jgi:CheY-like chemotaxis protein